MKRLRKMLFTKQPIQIFIILPERTSLTKNDCNLQCPLRMRSLCALGVSEKGLSLLKKEYEYDEGIQGPEAKRLQVLHMLPWNSLMSLEYKNREKKPVLSLQSVHGDRFSINCVHSERVLTFCTLFNQWRAIKVTN